MACCFVNVIYKIADYFNNQILRLRTSKRVEDRGNNKRTRVLGLRNHSELNVT